jgi:hypothetical protein
MSYRTDFEVAEDLEYLTILINDSIEQATKILDEAKEINEVRKLIEEIKTSRQSLDLTRNEVIGIEDRLDPLKTLPEKLQTLGINENLLKDIQEAIIIAEKNKEEIYESEKKVIKLNQETDSLSTKISNDAEEIKKIFTVYEQKTANANITLNQLRSILVDIGTIEERLKPLRILPDELQKLGIDNTFLKNIQEMLIVVEKNKEEIYESEKKIVNLNELNHKLSRKIDNGAQAHKKTVDIFKEKVIEAKIHLNDVKSVLAEIGTIDEIKLLLNELKVARSQLTSSRKELVAVRKFEAYLQEFQVHSSSKQFKKWLWKELGFVGILIYFLSIIIPKNRKNN